MTTGGNERGGRGVATPSAMARRTWMAGVAALVGGCASRPRAAGARVELPAEAWRRDLHQMVDTVARRHTDPFHTIAEGALQARVAQLDARIPSLSPEAIVVALREVLASIGDAATRLHTPPQALGPRLPIVTRRFDDGVFVVEAHHGHAELLGARILEVDGQPIAGVLQGLGAIVSADTEHGRSTEAAALVGYLSVLHALGLAREPRALRLRLQTISGESTERTLEAVDASHRAPWAAASDGWEPRPVAHQRPTRWYWQQYLSAHSALYVRYRRCEEQSFERFGRFAAAFADAYQQHEPERVVIDLRQNPGGDPALFRDLLRRLQRRPPEALYCVVDEGVRGAASMNAVQLQRMLGATVVGMPTGGMPYGYGRAQTRALEHSGLEFSYARSRTNDPDGQPPGPVVPDVKVPLRFDDYAVGRDLAVAHALRA